MWQPLASLPPSNFGALAPFAGQAAQSPQTPGSLQAAQLQAAPAGTGGPAPLTHAQLLALQQAQMGQGGGMQTSPGFIDPQQMAGQQQPMMPSANALGAWAAPYKLQQLGGF